MQKGRATGSRYIHTTVIFIIAKEHAPVSFFYFIFVILLYIYRYIRTGSDKLKLPSGARRERFDEFQRSYR